MTLALACLALLKPPVRLMGHLGPPPLWRSEPTLASPKALLRLLQLLLLLELLVLLSLQQLVLQLEHSFPR